MTADHSKDFPNPLVANSIRNTSDQDDMGGLWARDSGATHHVTEFSTSMNDFEAVRTAMSIPAGSTYLVRYGEQGIILANDDGDEQEAFLHKLAYVPSSEETAITLNAIGDRKFDFHLSKPGVTIEKMEISLQQPSHYTSFQSLSPSFVSLTRSLQREYYF